MRLIYLDISTINIQRTGAKKGSPYIKLINQREKLNFKVHETYSLYVKHHNENENSISIGRENKNEIVIKDPYISGRHAQFILMGENVFLKDTGSTNGTFVNGEQIQNNEVCLKNWDKISLGQIEFIFICS